MENSKFKLEELKVYQKALDFIDLAYVVCEGFPETEKYALSSQYTRAAVSVALNIAEGASDTGKQFNRFLQIALGSVNECVVCSTIAKRQNYILSKTDDEARSKLTELSKMIAGLQKHLKGEANH